MGIFDSTDVETTQKSRSKSANRSGVVRSTRTTSALPYMFRPELGLSPGQIEGISSARSTGGTYSPLRMPAFNFRPNSYSPTGLRGRRLGSNMGWGMTLTQAAGPKKGKSSQDTTQEAYSTSETRFGKANVANPNSGYAALGGETASAVGNIAQMFRANSSNIGAARRKIRSLF